MLKIKDTEKSNIIQDLLNQRYQAEHLMRQRSSDFTKWLLGFGIGLLWIVLSSTPLSLIQKILLSAFIFLLVLSGYYFLYEMYKGFIVNRRIIIKLETALGLYGNNIYLENDSLYPEKYKQIDNVKVFSHFKTLFILLIIISISLITMIFANPVSQDINNNVNHNKQKIEHKGE